MEFDADIIVVGAGAAGLMAAIQAARTAPEVRVIALDGAKSLGAKILVAGGGRCNVTHDVVDETAFAGSTRPAIRKVLLQFDVQRTIAFFKELGVELKREETGKLFPTTDSARTVLNALLDAARAAHVTIRFPWRVQAIRQISNLRFEIQTSQKAVTARRVILATGGRSLPKSGSDGHGYSLAQSLGHSLTERIFPALVPLLLPAGHFLRELSGISTTATVEVRSSTTKRLASFTDSMLCTHFGLSGPAILDISRYLTDARLDDAGANLVINWLPGETVERVDAWLLQLGAKSLGRAIGERLPRRLADAICASVEVDATMTVRALSRDVRRSPARALTEMEIPIEGDRGYTHAEVTAGGVPLRELHLNTMESRLCPGLHLCGEICDVDGRIGGYNFQWAWASGLVAGCAAARSLKSEHRDTESTEKSQR